MIPVFIEFTARAMRNRIQQAVHRLRDPRYLIGGIAAVAYFWLIFFRNTRSRPPQLTGNLLVDILSIVVLGLMIVAWALPSDSGGLQFSQAEIAMLFSAPLRRRDLLLYKIIRAQPQALTSAFFFFLFGFRRSWFIGTYAAIAVLGIYFTLVALGRARLKLMHIGFVARLIIVSILLTALASFGVDHFKSSFALVRQGKTRNFSVEPAVAAQQIDDVFRTGAARTILFVPRIFANSASAPTPATLGAAVAELAVLGLVFFVLAARLNISFEEASIAASARRAALLQRLRDNRGGRRAVTLRTTPPFRLGETGAPEIAILWKNVIALVRTSVGFVVVLLAICGVMVAVAVYRNNDVAYHVIGGLMFVICGFFPLTGPQIFANDLRLDLARAEILKSYPLAGDRLVAAEIGAPLAVITAFELLFLTCGIVLVRMAGPSSPLAAVVNPEFIVAALILILPLCAILLVIRNAIPLYFPAWSMRAPDDVRSFVNVGQRLVMVFGNLFALLIALIPAAIVFVPSMFLAVTFFKGNAIFAAVATVPAAAVISGEVWLGIKALGARFDEMDVSNEFDLVTV